MNIFELTLLIGFIWVGYVCGKMLGAYLGVAGWIVGFVLGCALAVGVYTIFLRLIDLWYRWRPIRPICKEGKCSSDDYQLLELSKGNVVFRCRCGAKYIKTRHRFGELLDDGSVRPYMKRTWSLGRWEEDRGESVGE
ncbi:MAG: hypothetical protein JXM79_18740 [Sedimentisphaerales bacterium]|nr:hypothetical protein [Sedimentisphaerales bacterium]